MKIELEEVYSCYSIMYLPLCCLYLFSIYYRSEAVSLTCDNTTDVCPGTELTCTCSVSSAGLIWRLPGSVTIALDDKVGSNDTTTNGIFFAVIIANNTGGVLESMLIYTANESLVNVTIMCSGNAGARTVSTTITVTLAG